MTKDSSFSNLKDDIYYATYNYSFNSTGELKGKYYLIISKGKNTVLSFLTNADQEYLSELNPAVLALLKTIDIDKQITDETTIGDTLNSLSSWNRYPELRANATGRKKTIYGEFRTLSDSPTYWIFKNGEFWWYKSEEDLKDNYWYGSITVKTGKAGMKSVGLDGDKLDTILKQSNGKVTAGDVYTIVMTPKIIISDGEDKSEDNIPEDSKWKFIWIIVDHGDEGIEAQVLNVDTGDTYYLVKVKD